MDNKLDVNAAGEPGAGSGGLDLADQRLLMRLIFFSTGVTLAVFSVLQTLSGNYLLAALEASVCALLLWATRRLKRVVNLTPWIYAYLLPTFSFLVYIIIMPAASVTAFVWLYFMPVIAYLMLGARRGFLLSVPFVAVAILLYLRQHPMRLDAPGMIDLGNALICGVLILAFVHIYETRRAQAQQQLRRMALSDALTGVASREAFQRALLRCQEEARAGASRWVLVVLDVDHFKTVNDRWGHDAGDKALQLICARLRMHLRASDMVGRLGGEEFALLLRNTGRQDAEPLVERLRLDLVANPLLYRGNFIPLSATFGLAEWPRDGQDIEALYRCADRRLYSGKALGRNRLVCSDS
ncbi:GGDEF domain-containing protein [Pseudomonas citronellolis]|uniref:GGDEF domain-containing protein n=1 Tax=Pseudomonas citronellolis TaxID=53408 RepID=UPI0023E3ECC6|nr:GGDEF domain-containing protein [Pseudomonas citronellolis]MDF3931740.1 GGDEF domain-containing protein [Pseudomonas citronellolis]